MCIRDRYCGARIVLYLFSSVGSFVWPVYDHGLGFKEMNSSENIVIIIIIIIIIAIITLAIRPSKENAAHVFF